MGTLPFILRGLADINLFPALILAHLSATPLSRSLLFRRVRDARFRPISVERHFVFSVHRSPPRTSPTAHRIFALTILGQE